VRALPNAHALTQSSVVPPGLNRFSAFPSAEALG